MTRHGWSLLAVLAAACGDDGGTAVDAGGVDAFVADAVPGAPVVTVTATPQSVAPGAAVSLVITATNFTFEAPAGQPNEPGHGFYRVYLDDGELLAGADGTEDIFVPADAAAGPHELRAVLFQNDQTPVEPAAEGTTTLTVE